MPNLNMWYKTLYKKECLICHKDDILLDDFKNLNLLKTKIGQFDSDLVALSTLINYFHSFTKLIYTQKIFNHFF